MCTAENFAFGVQTCLTLNSELTPLLKKCKFHFFPSAVECDVGLTLLLSTLGGQTVLLANDSDYFVWLSDRLAPFAYVHVKKGYKNCAASTCLPFSTQSASKQLDRSLSDLNELIAPTSTAVAHWRAEKLALQAQKKSLQREVGSGFFLSLSFN